MATIKERFKGKADGLSAEIKDILKEHGSKTIGEVTLAQIYQGMRGITGLVTETSLLDPQEGIRFRGFSIPELQERLPKANFKSGGGAEPLPEGLFHLMLLGELPTETDVHDLTANWQRRSHVPNHVFAAIHDEEVTFGILVSDVPCAKHAITECGFSFVRIIPVATHNVCAAYN